VNASNGRAGVLTGTLSQLPTVFLIPALVMEALLLYDRGLARGYLAWRSEMPIVAHVR